MIEKRIKPKKVQADFLYSKARFPAFGAGWGSGKTMFGIMKGLDLSKKYPDNLGLICRKKFVDLRDSTMRDFERYTGLTINRERKEVVVGDSIIMFRHADELSALQNINLGWAMIEQAEEFDTDESFQMLRGRLRREGCLHQLIVVYNKNGHNWNWKLWERDKKPDYELFQMTTFDNEDNLPADFIKDLRRMEVEAPRKFARFVMNSSDQEVEGTIYGQELALVVKQGRLCNVPYDPSYPVYTFSDLGIDDPTAIWFMQYVGKEVRWIDYYEANNEPLAHYWKVLQNKPYAYAKHYLPFDAGSRSLQTGITTAEQARRLGWKVEVQPRVDVLPGIDLVRAVINQSWYDAVKCGPGFEAMQAYRWRKNERLSTEEHPHYHDEPIHDWSSHASDAMRYASYVIQLHRESLYRPRTFDFPREYRKPMVARNLIYAH